MVEMEKGKVRLSVPKIQSDSVVDGEGIRSVIWFQGCSHNCPGCHNPETHDFNAGYEFDLEEVKGWIRELEYQQGVTFSGGDPMMQVDALIELAKVLHESNMNVWVYTGFTYEELINLELKLVDATATYKYNSKYDIYENMTDDEKFMNDVYKYFSK